MDARHGESARRSRPWPWLLVALAAVGLVALAAWLWTQSSSATATQRMRLQAALDKQKSLNEDLAKAPAAASEPTSCPPGQALRPVTTDGPKVAAGSASQPAAGPVAAAPTSSPSASAAAATGEAVALGGAALAQRLERSTAIVLVQKQKGLGLGTGFFVAPNLLVTNRHVIEGGTGKQVFVTSRSLGSMRRATILHATQASTAGSPDLALLRMDDGTSAGVLEMTAETSKLSGVVAAGYPGLVVNSDADFQRLLRGDVSAAPDLNLTQGTVQSLQSGSGGMPLVVHTAAISQGNSGGPLVDNCGRVIGVNTYAVQSAGAVGSVNYAIRTPAVSSFLAEARQQASIDVRPCAAKG